MKELTLSMDKSLFTRLQSAAMREGKAVDVAIAEGVAAYVSAAEEALADDETSYDGGALVTGLN